jgi:hypothetical protein
MAQMVACLPSKQTQGSEFEQKSPKTTIAGWRCLPMQVLAGTDSREIQNETQDKTTRNVEGT